MAATQESRRSSYPFRKCTSPWLAALVGVHFPGFSLPGCGAARVTRNGCAPRCFQFLGSPFRRVALLAGAVHDDRVALAASRLLRAGREIAALQRNVDRARNLRLLKSLGAQRVDQGEVSFPVASGLEF